MTEHHPPVITIDGPSGSGKSTLGRALATRFGLQFVDTGLLYRGLTLAVIQHGLTAADTVAIAELAHSAHLELNTDPTKSPATWDLRINGWDPNGEIRNPAHARLLSEVSAIPAVRTALLSVQRAFGIAGCVAVGRDCGMVIFPDACAKIYLEASDAIRRHRRASQFEEQGTAVDASVLSREITERDRLDAPRTFRDPDACVINTDLNDIDEMIRLAVQYCEDMGCATPSGSSAPCHEERV
ncbi:MAG: (d)CMP kinase [Candidatus Dormibacteria bacterium]